MLDQCFAHPTAIDHIEHAGRHGGFFRRANHRIGYLLGGAVVIEVIFAIPGMGTLILNGVTNNEPNLVQGVTLAVSLAFVVINIIVDLLYVLINPRIRAV